MKYEINSLSDINTEIPEGKLAMAALARLTTSIDSHRTPEESIEQTNKLIPRMFDVLGTVHAPTNKEKFMTDFKAANTKARGLLSKMVVAVKLPTKTTEIIINTEKLDDKYAYYLEAYDEDMKLKSMPKIQLVGWMFI